MTILDLHALPFWVESKVRFACHSLDQVHLM